MKLRSSCPLLSGCFWVTTKSEGEQLRKDVTSVQERLSTKEQKLDEQIKQLQTVLDESSKLLKRNSADLGADVEGLSRRHRTANGLVAAVNNSVNEVKTAFDTYKKANDARLDALEQRLAQIESGKPSASSSPDELWKLGSTAFETARYNDAIDIFKRLVDDLSRRTIAPTTRSTSAARATRTSRTGTRRSRAYQVVTDKYPDSAARRRRAVLRRPRRAAAQELHRSAHVSRRDQAEVHQGERAQAGRRAREGAEEGREEQVEVQLVAAATWSRAPWRCRPRRRGASRRRPS